MPVSIANTEVCRDPSASLGIWLRAPLLHARKAPQISPAGPMVLRTPSVWEPGQAQGKLRSLPA
jgi:hypothetical protein